MFYFAGKSPDSLLMVNLQIEAKSRSGFFLLFFMTIPLYKAFYFVIVDTQIDYNEVYSNTIII